MRWLRQKHPRITWRLIKRRYQGEDGIQANGVVVSNPGSISVTRYRCRGANIPNPWTEIADPTDPLAWRVSYQEQLPLKPVQQALA